MDLDSVGTAGGMSNTEVLLQVESEVSHPEGVHHVLADEFEPLDTLLAGVGSGLRHQQTLHVTDPGRLADVAGPVHKVVLDDHEESLSVVTHHLILALLCKLSQAGAVVLGEVRLE